MGWSWAMNSLRWKGGVRGFRKSGLSRRVFFHQRFTVLPSIKLVWIWEARCLCTMLKQHQLLNKSHLVDKLDPSVSLSRCCHQFVKFQSSFEMWVSLPLLPSGESEWISYLPYFSGMLVAFFLICEDLGILLGFKLTTFQSGVHYSYQQAIQRPSSAV